MLPEQKVLRAEMNKHIKIDTKKGVMIFLFDICSYMICLSGVLFLPELWMKISASIFAGIFITNLSVVAHDAAHNSLTNKKFLNKIIAVTSLIPCLYNYKLWLYDHNYMHHAKTNENHPDSYTPLSKEEYDSLSEFGKFKQRLYRHPTILFFGLYYICERWIKVKLYPRDNFPKDKHADAWLYTAAIGLYASIFISLLLIAPTYSNTSSLLAISLGFIVPFYVFQSLYAFAVYLQHTHPSIPWFNYSPDRKNEARSELVTAHIVCPKWFDFMTHHILDHAAHHLCPLIPCYELGNAQKELEDMLGKNAVKLKLSLNNLYEVMKYCKLYDYDNHCWLNFNGMPTTTTIFNGENIVFKTKDYKQAA